MAYNIHYDLNKFISKMIKQSLKPTMSQITTDRVFEEAYGWLCTQRKDHSHNNAVCDLRYHWESIKPTLTQNLIDGTYRFSPMQRYKIHGKYISSWSALDALVLKATKIVLQPLIAAIYLKPLDDAMEGYGFYRRFMDDWVIRVKTKHQLRKVIRLTYKILNALRLKMHPKKTFLGCIKKGFDFLGVHFGDTPEISKTSLENHRSKIAQRYARGASDACIGDYIARWLSWCAGILKRCELPRTNNLMSSERSRHSGCIVHIKESYHETILGKNI